MRFEPKGCPVDTSCRYGPHGHDNADFDGGVFVAVQNSVNRRCRRVPLPIHSAQPRAHNVSASEVLTRGRGLLSVSRHTSCVGVGRRSPFSDVLLAIMHPVGIGVDNSSIDVLDDVLVRHHVSALAKRLDQFPRIITVHKVRYGPVLLAVPEDY